MGRLGADGEGVDSDGVVNTVCVSDWLVCVLDSGTDGVEESETTGVCVSTTAVELSEVAVTVSVGLEVLSDKDVGTGDGSTEGDGVGSAVGEGEGSGDGVGLTVGVGSGATPL